MRKTRYTYRFGKLVRDKTVPEYELEESVLAVDWRVLDDMEYKQALVDKLHEEAGEIPVQESADEEVVAEIADLRDVLLSLMEAYGVNEDQVMQASAKKAKKRGAFKDRHHIETITVTPDSYWREYCLKDPERYPEVETNEQPRQRGPRSSNARQTINKDTKSKLKS